MLIAGVPAGYDALFLARLARSRPADAPAVLVHVALDDARMAQLAAGLAFFASDVEVLTFPAWDCLPYDRVSPHRDIVAQRIDTLTRLLAAEVGGPRRIVLTTVSSFLQRVPARSSFAGKVLELTAGLELPQDELVAFLEGNGYLRGWRRRCASTSSATRSSRSAASIR